MYTGRELISLSNSFRKCRMKEGLILHECMFSLIFAVKLKLRNSPSKKTSKTSSGSVNTPVRRSSDLLNVNSELMLDLLFETNYSRIGEIDIVGQNFLQISLG